MSDIGSDDLNSSNNSSASGADQQEIQEPLPRSPSPTPIDGESSFDISVAAENDSRSVTPKPTQDVSDGDMTLEKPAQEASLDNKERVEEDEEEVPTKKRRVQVDSDEEEDTAKASAEGDSENNSGGEAEVSSTKRRVALDSDDEEEDIADKNERELRAANPNLFDNGSSDESDNDNDEQKKELMANIFGEDSDDEDSGKAAASSSKAAEEDEDEPRYLGRERPDEDEVDDTKEWDFDLMMKKKKKENKKRRRRKDGTVDLISDMDDQVKELVEKMQEAASQDRVANAQRKPALKKRKMLAVVRQTLLRADLFDTFLDNHMMSAISEWMAPLPDKSLPALEIRTTLLKILQGYTRLEQGILKQSGLGKAVMLLYKHPRETKENKEIANRLIGAWSRPIFQLDSDMRTLDKDERTQRDFEHIPAVKRKNMSLEDYQQRLEEAQKKKEKVPPPPPEDESVVRVGDKGFVGRARVPQPSTRDYIVRPKPKTEAQFRGATKSKSNTRLDRAQRDFLERTKKNKAMRAVTISLEGRNLL
uniref:TFIIS N-terminal domain-containing protein n=1 Tax=Steinernema glaseri TaxID=37863 RepID=A0A1I7YY35_9BILA